MSPELSEVVVTRLEPWGSECWRVCWKRGFEFRAGQVVTLAASAQGPRRHYSLATGSTASEAGVLFNRVEGELTPVLARLRPGDSLWVGQPFGSFPPIEGAAVWIANGTGVAPFVSMVESGLAVGKSLIHGARTLDTFWGGSLFEKALGSDYVRCCSGESHPDVYPGRLTHYLEERDWSVDLRYLLCGSAPIIVEVRELLFRKGVPFRHILSEVFF